MSLRPGSRPSTRVRLHGSRRSRRARKERPASAFRAALPADVGRPAPPGRLIPRVRARPAQNPSLFPSREGSPRLFLPVVGLLRPGPSEEPEQTRHALRRRPSNPTTCLSECWGQRARLSVRPRRPLLKDPRPCEAPEALSPAPLPPEYRRPASQPHLTPGSPNTLSQLENLTPTPASRAAHVRPAPSERPTPGEEPPGSRPLGRSGSRPVRSGGPGFLSSPARSRPLLFPPLPGLFPPSLPARPSAFPVGPGGGRALGG